MHKIEREDMHSLYKQDGFTLIELMITVVIIAVLAATAVPLYLGLQDRARKGAVIKVAASSSNEITAWLQSARKGSSLIEVDSNGDGTIDNNDVDSQALANDLTVQDQLCSRYVTSRAPLNEVSPWDPAVPLWIVGSTASGRLTCAHGSGATKLYFSARDKNGVVFYSKYLTSD